MQRLAEGDSATGEHFAAYFSNVLVLKLRVRLRSAELIEDITQETLLRVLSLLRRPGGIKRPERFGAFVSGVCENVTRELRRIDEHDESWEENSLNEPADPAMDLDAGLTSAEAKAVVRRVFADLAEKERRLLQAVYLDEIPKDEACHRFETNPSNLRVLLCRARKQFRDVYHSTAGLRPMDFEESAGSAEAPINPKEE